MCRRKVGGCCLFPSLSLLWYMSFEMFLHVSMYPVVEPLPYSGCSIHRLVVFVCKFVSRLLSHDPGACAPLLLLILVQLPFTPCYSMSNQDFDLQSSRCLHFGEALATWRLLDLSCRAISWGHLGLTSDCLLDCRLLRLHVLVNALSLWLELLLLALLSFFGYLQLLSIKFLRLVLLLTLLLCIRLSIFAQLSAALSSRTNKAWALSLSVTWRQDKGC